MPRDLMGKTKTISALIDLGFFGKKGPKGKCLWDQISTDAQEIGSRDMHRKREFLTD